MAKGARLMTLGYTILSLSRSVTEVCEPTQRIPQSMQSNTLRSISGCQHRTVTAHGRYFNLEHSGRVDCSRIMERQITCRIDGTRQSHPRHKLHLSPFGSIIASAPGGWNDVMMCVCPSHPGLIGKCIWQYHRISPRWLE